MRCLADLNLVGGDLLPILASWPENATDNRFKARAALACFEIIVPLTWPLDRPKEEMTVNHHRHIPVLQLAQIGYKRDIINYDAAPILRTAVRVALPSLAVPKNERTTRDEGIIKLVLLFLRNIAMISPSANVQYYGDESQISRSALIDAFSYQDILLTILTLASNMGEDFNQEGVIVMEIIFHLVKRVDVSKLFLDQKELSTAKANELTDMMRKEAAMHRPHNRRAPTRHNRWGTMIWVNRGDGKVSTVSGQDALLDVATRQQKMDSKIYRPPRRPTKDETVSQDLGPPVTLNPRARKQLCDFVGEFLDSGFNPLFMLVRKKLDEQKDYIFQYHPRQFFYLVSWFLEAERARKATRSSQKGQQEEVGSFNLVAGVLNQETFITLNRSMADAFESKNWQELSAAMRCFTQILLTVQAMTESGNEEDEEIAENMLSRIFYEGETHDRIATIARTYKDQGFEYLDACTELTHTYLRVLEAYSKQNVDMHVRSRRRTRRKKAAAAVAADEDGGSNPVEEEDESENDQASAERTSTERKFEFSTFAKKFTPQGVVDTFVKFTKYYHDLNDAQLKRAHRYFYRLAFKQDSSVMLFRVDIIHLFYTMMRGTEPLDRGCNMHKEWEELVKQILKRCIRKIEERPALIIEMLFSKIPATAHYLEYGYEKQTISKSTPKAAAELEFKHTLDREQQIAIAVGVLLDKELAHHIKWVKAQLAAVESERRAWETAEKAMPSVEANANGGASEEADKPSEVTSSREPPVFCKYLFSLLLHCTQLIIAVVRPDDSARRTAMFKNGHLRLLMKLVGMTRLITEMDETPESAWVVYPSHTADQLQESIDLINKAEFNPPTFDDGKLAENQLRRKTAPRKKAVYDDEDDGDDEEFLFPAGGPTVRKVIDDGSEEPKKTKKRRFISRKLTKAQLAEKEGDRRRREKEKARRFKSDLYVHASDDETDEERDREFFAGEERLRQKQKTLILGGQAKPPPSVKQKVQVLLDDDGDEDDALVLTQESTSSLADKVDDDEEEDEGDESEADDTPPSSSPRGESAGGSLKRRRVSEERSPVQDMTGLTIDDTAMADVDEEDGPVAKQPRRRPRAMAGFIIDSSDEE